MSGMESNPVGLLFGVYIGDWHFTIGRLNLLCVVCIICI